MHTFSIGETTQNLFCTLQLWIYRITDKESFFLQRTLNDLTGMPGVTSNAMHAIVRKWTIGILVVAINKILQGQLGSLQKFVHVNPEAIQLVRILPSSNSNFKSS
jgi:hypothetical protein